MSIEQAEQLKREYTDKWVVVDPGVPELKRFAGLTGKVKTVNMNCRALVEFDGPANIGWFDIDLGSLTVVDAPIKKEKPAHSEEPKPAEKKKAAAGSASPLDLIRKGGASGAAKAAGAAKKPAGGASPLDLIRKQGAARTQSAAETAASADEAAAAEATASEPAEEKKPVGGDAKLSPLDLIRKQGAAKH
ncbi:hypothetical protein GC176_07125 [bacterium]|nr:hypothetical protein [bacterium]